MAGRRRGGALAGAVGLASNLFLYRQEQQRQMQQKAIELRTKFLTEMAAEQYKKTGAYTNPFTGQAVGMAKPFTPSPGMVPYEETDPFSGRKYRNPALAPYYDESLGTGILPSIPETPAPDLRQRAIQELQALGAPVTEANIQAAMQQLSGT